MSSYREAVQGMGDVGAAGILSIPGVAADGRDVILGLKEVAFTVK